MGFTAVMIGVVIALVAIIGIRPRGGKPVGNTQLMTVARVVLVVIALVVLFFAFRR
jgi:cytochrome c biogenesis factor